MKKTKIFLIILIVITITKVQAQDYLINFVGNGASSTVDSVQVKNLTQGTSLTLNGSDILHLTNGVTRIKTVSLSNKFIQIYPNPVITDCNVEFKTANAGLVRLELFDITGKKVNSFENNFTSGVHTLSINGLSSGVYTLNLATDEGSYLGKIISKSKASGIATINYVNSKETTTNNIIETTNFRSASTTSVDMAYTTGDRILLKGVSGNYANLISIIPTASSTQTFNFVVATDYDGNNYTTLTIGTQVWMVENLKVTRYNNGTDIPNVTDATEWKNLITGAYCYNNNDSTNCAKYGRLYNWYAVNAGNLAPTGWHIPSDAEWQVLEDYLITNGYNYDGTTTDDKIAKSLATTTGWISSTNPGAIGNNLSLNNSTGFSAVSGGCRNQSGTFFYLGELGYWWCTTEYSTTHARNRYFGSGSFGISSFYFYKKYGFSVRCVKD